MKTVDELVAECLKTVNEILPWDLQEHLQTDSPPQLLDVREPSEFQMLHIKGSINVPRGVLEQACDYGYDETVPELAAARDQKIIVICQSGKHSALAAHTMQQLGYQSVLSLRTGVKGWNDYELPLQNIDKQIVDINEADTILVPHVQPEQMGP